MGRLAAVDLGDLPESTTSTAGVREYTPPATLFTRVLGILGIHTQVPVLVPNQAISLARSLLYNPGAG